MVIVSIMKFPSGPWMFENINSTSKQTTYSWAGSLLALVTPVCSNWKSKANFGERVKVNVSCLVNFGLVFGRSSQFITRTIHVAFILVCPSRTLLSCCLLTKAKVLLLDFWETCSARSLEHDISRSTGTSSQAVFGDLLKTSGISDEANGLKIASVLVCSTHLLLQLKYSSATIIILKRLAQGPNSTLN